MKLYETSQVGFVFDCIYIYMKLHIWIMVHNYTTITYNPSTLSAWHTTTTVALDVICQGAERKVPRHHSRNRVQRSWAPCQKRYSKFWDRMEYREVFGDCIYIYILYCNYMYIRHLVQGVSYGSSFNYRGSI